MNGVDGVAFIRPAPIRSAYRPCSQANLGHQQAIEVAFVGLHRHVPSSFAGVMVGAEELYELPELRFRHLLQHVPVDGLSLLQAARRLKQRDARADGLDENVRIEEENGGGKRRYPDG